MLRSLFDRPPAKPLNLIVEFDGESYAVEVKRHRQARRYTLRVHQAKRSVVLTMPLRGSLREAKRFADKHGGWIAARLRRLPEPAPFCDGAIVPATRRGAPDRASARRARCVLDRSG